MAGEFGEGSGKPETKEGEKGLTDPEIKDGADVESPDPHKAASAGDQESRGVSLTDRYSLEELDNGAGEEDEDEGGIELDEEEEGYSGYGPEKGGW